MKTDGLAEKIYALVRQVRSPKRPHLWLWSDLSDDERAEWERLAFEVRTHQMLADADAKEALLNISAGDPEMLVYEPGIRLMIESTRRACAKSPEETAAIAAQPMPGTKRPEPS